MSFGRIPAPPLHHRWYIYISVDALYDERLHAVEMKLDSGHDAEN